MKTRRIPAPPGAIFTGTGLALLMALTPAKAQDVYGAKIAPKDVSEEVEACEYRMLVEEQTCNERLNKNDCIKEIHRYCLETFDAAPAVDMFDKAPLPQGAQDPEGPN